MVIVIAILVAMTIAVGVSPARATTINACASRKLKTVGKAVLVETTCWARDATKPNPLVLAGCLGKSARRFDGGDDPSAGAFAKLERRSPCLTVDDQGSMRAAVATLGTNLASEVANPGIPNRCDAAKLTCVAHYVAGISACLARAVATTGMIDVRCLGKEASRLADRDRGCLRKAEMLAACSVVGDGAVLQGEADQFAAAMLCALDPTGTSDCTALPTPVPTPTRTATPVATRTPSPAPSAGDGGAAQLCVDLINQYRASIGRPPYARWVAAETCVDGQGLADSQTHVPHSAFGQCGEWAQNECPGWPGPPEGMIGGCLQAMWNEGPGSDFSLHGHYINMASTQYTRVGCGFTVLPNGSVWAVQDFQ